MNVWRVGNIVAAAGSNYYGDTNRHPVSSHLYTLTESWCTYNYCQFFKYLIGFNGKSAASEEEYRKPCKQKENL